MNNSTKYAARRAALRRFGLVDRVKAGLGMRSEADMAEPVNGIRYTSHPNGRYSHNDHFGVNTELSAVRHALTTLGIIPKRKPSEDWQQYSADVDRAVRLFTDGIRKHVHSNPGDALSRHYLNTADRLRVPPDTDAKAGERTYIPSLPVGVRELAGAVAPLIKKVAEDTGIRPRREVLIPVEPPPLPPEPEANPEPDTGVVDLLEPHLHEGDPEALAAGYLHDLPDVPVPGPRPTPSPGKRPGFGAGKPKPVGEGVYQSDDFNLPSIDLGTSPAIRDVQRAKAPSPAAAMDKAAVHQSIADHLAGGGGADALIPHLKDKFGLTARQAGSMFEAYKKLKVKPKGNPPEGYRPPSQNRIKPLGSKTKRSNRVYARRFARIHPAQVHDVYGPFWRKIGEDPTNALTHLGAMADRADEVDDESPLAMLYRKMWEQQGGDKSRYGGHKDLNINASLYESGHHSVWSPDRQTLIQHSFIPTADGSVLARVGATAFGYNGVGSMGVKGSNSGGVGYVTLTQPEVEAVINHLKQVPDGSFHWAQGQDHPDGDGSLRRRVTNPITHLRNSIQVVTGTPGAATPDPTEVSNDESDEVPEENEPHQYAAYRAPAGGPTVVRGTAYAPGEMIPDMGGRFVSPRKKAAGKGKATARKQK